jgi:hypothetical protein
MKKLIEDIKWIYGWVRFIVPGKPKPERDYR